MKSSDLLDLCILAALWGASFMFMRVAAPEFGPVALAALRVIGASLLLMPLLVLRGQAGELRRHWFPLFGAVIAWLWLRDRLTRSGVLGLAIGFGGVLWMVWDRASFQPGGSLWAVLACLGAPILYGVSTNYTKRFLTGVPSLVVAAGSLLAAALLLVVPAVIWWPPVPPSARAWGAALVLAVACTAVAYVLFFRLIASIGPARTISVTFLIPAFAMLWGRVFLGELLTWHMVAGCAVILLGTALATGAVRLSGR